MTSKEIIQVGALSVRFLVEAADSNGSASVVECFVPANSKMPAPHSHDAFEETIYGLEGVTTWTVDGRTLDIQAGEAVCIARGAIHGFENHRTGDAKFLAITTRGVEREWIALATGRSGVWGFGFGMTQENPGQKALTTCRTFSPEATVSLSFFATQGPARS